MPRRTSAAIVAMLLLAAACEAAERPAGAGRSASANGLCLTIDLPRARYEAWESIDVTATLANAGKGKLVVSPWCVSLKFEGAGARFLLYPKPVPPWYAGAKSLGAGEQLAVKMPGLRHGGGVWQLQPGKYEVAAEYALPADQAAQAKHVKLPAGRVWTGRLRSPWVPLEVVPASPIHARVSGLIKQGKSDEVRRGLLKLGPKAEAELLRMLRDPGMDSTDRTPVLYGLGMVRSKAAVEDLLPLLESRHDAEAHAAAWALGEIGDKRACVPLCRLIEKLPPHSTLRTGALAALQHVADKRAVPTLRKLAASEDYQTAGRAIAALQAVTGEDHVGRAIAGLFPKDRKPGDDWGSKEAYHNFFRLKYMGPIAADALLKAFEQADDEHRAKRLGTLLYLILQDGHEKERIVSAFLRKLSAKDPMVRRAMPFLLREQRTDRVIEALTARLEDDNDYVRKAAAEVLGNFKARQAAEPLLKMMRDHSRWGGRCAVLPLAKFEDATIEAAILAEYDKGNWEFRYRCLWAFGFHGSDKAAAWLADIAENAADPRERKEAANSLARRKELKARK